MSDIEAAVPLRRLLARPGFLRLWSVGALANGMRWLEILVAGLFTFEVTGSALAVAAVTTLRALPMLLAGALTGALAEVLDRRRLLLAGQIATALGSATVALLAAGGGLRIWHLALNNLLGGLVWTGELAARRRMLTEAAGEAAVVRAVALDAVTNSTTRMLGPVLGGLAYEGLGLAAAYAISAGSYLLSATLIHGVRHHQVPAQLHLRRILADMAAGARAVRASPVLLAVVVVTFATNVFGFSFTAVLPALGERHFGATPVGVGLLAAAEPAGALLAGLALALRRGVPLSTVLLAAGPAGFLACLLLLPLMPSLAAAILLLLLGGLGTALFSALQTALVVVRAPPEARSRVLGLVTTCIGTGPLGVLAVGALSDAIGPAQAIPVMAACGLLVLLLALPLFRR